MGIPQEQMNRVRCAQAHREVVALSSSFKEWLSWHTNDDGEVGRHRSQLQALDALFTKALEALHEKVLAVDLTRDVGAVYDECRDYEEAAVWLRRLWEFFKTKLDQRHINNPEVRELLRAADEVVWSCYRQVFMDNPDQQQGPTPLAYIEPEFSPAALQADRALPAGFRLPPDLLFLGEYVTGMPIPVLRLPPWCLDSPWWLIYIAHEVGHFVLHQLQKAVEFTKAVKAVAENKKSDAGYWTRCAEEIFADLFSVRVIGPWAVWSIAEVEWSTPDKMVGRKPPYPSPLARLAMLSYAADTLMSPDGGKTPGTEGTAALRGLKLDATGAAAADIEVARAIVDMAYGTAEQPGLLRKVWKKFDPNLFRPHNTIDQWASYLSDGATGEPNKKQVATGRQVVCGALRAWEKVVSDPGLDDAAREQRGRKLAGLIKTTLINNAPAGTRAEMVTGGEQPKSGDDLLSDLLKVIKHRASETPAPEPAAGEEESDAVQD